MSACICIDTSGSVNYNSLYWIHVSNIVNDWIERFPDTIIIEWNSSAKKISFQDLSYLLKYKSGRGGTNPEFIIPLLSNLKATENVCLITDGEIDSYQVEQTDKLISQHKLQFTNTECHIINLRPNLSVCCPFTRGNNSKVISYSGYFPVVEQSILASDYKIIENLENISLDTFLEKFEIIKDMIYATTIGTAGSPLIKNKVIELKKRLINEISAAKEEYSPLLRQSSNPSEAVKITEKMINEYYSLSNLSDISKKLDKLVQICGDMRTTFTKTDIQYNGLARAETAESSDPIESEDFSDFECPITYESDTPCIIITEGESILTGVEKNKVEFIVECPLRLLLDKDLVQKTRLRLSQSIGVKTLKNLDQDPFTRKEITGVICLGEDNIKATNWTLANLFSDGKILGNLNLWLLVCYWISKDCDYLSSITEIFLSHLRWRFSKEVVRASLSALGTQVGYKIPVDLSLWWILCSSCVEYNDVYSPKNDAVRAHLPEIDIIINSVVEIFGPEFVTSQMIENIETTKLLQKMVTLRKKRIYDWDDIKKCCFQNCSIIEDEIILLDGEQTSFAEFKNWIQKLVGRCPDFSPEIFYSAMMSARDTMGESRFTNYDLPKSKNNWKYEGMESYKIPICYKTFRPYTKYFDESLNREITWKDSFQLRYENIGGLSNIFSATKYFLEYIVKHKKVPTFEEFAIFAYKTITRSPTINRDTLPSNVNRIYTEIMEDYADLFIRAKNESLDIHSIASLLEKGRIVKDRVVIENN